ncbi:MAG: SMC-Scp complex subunit ScpB [Patescibacteria group bacterium]
MEKIFSSINQKLSIKIMLSLGAQIESILFFKAEPIKKNELAKILETSLEEIEDAVLVLENKLEDRGLVLLKNDDSLSLGTSPEMSEKIEFLRKEELVKDLGSAGLETLSIVLYKGPITRANIDYIRGVNSNFILRNLYIRGLIEKKDNPQDSRSYLYAPSFNLLSYLGISKIEELPEYDEVKKEYEKIEMINNNIE